MEVVFPSEGCETSMSFQILLPHLKEIFRLTEESNEDSGLIVPKIATLCGRGLVIMEKYDEAKAMCRQGPAGYEKALGTEHPNTLTTISSLGSVFESQGRW